MIFKFWHNQSTKAFIAFFILLSGLILFIDIKATAIFGFTFEEEIFFPVIGILLLTLGLLSINKKIAGKSKILIEWQEMNLPSKIFGFLSFFLIITAFTLAVFKDLSLFNINSAVITEEQIIAIGMLLSNLIFIYLYSKQILTKGYHD